MSSGGGAGGAATGPGAGIIGGGGTGYTRTALNVEEQNDERLDGLLGKVKILKDVSGKRSWPLTLSYVDAKLQTDAVGCG